MTQRVETVVVGGGQAGLAISYHLSQRGQEHIVLEQAAQAGNAWRNGRWPEALRAVADTGVGQHLRANLVSTTKGSVAIVTSVYRLPGAMLLVLTENAWQPAHGKAEGSATRRSGRRVR